MNDALLEPAERDRLKLRSAIADVALQMSTLSIQAEGLDHQGQTGILASSWSRLVPLIEPEPEPERRGCPHCQRRIMLHATRCMYCLEKSVPPGAEP
jgi:hypothetical protein